jgi:hypothetical protein
LLARIVLGIDVDDEWRIVLANPPLRLIQAIAAYSLALADRLDEARVHLAAIRKTLPQYEVGDFLKAMQFSPDDAAPFRKAASRIGGGM